MPEKDWQVRIAKETDITKIGELAQQSNEFLMPYVLNPWILRKYIYQFYVAEKVVAVTEPVEVKAVGGAVHVITSPSGVSTVEYDKVTCFLHYVKQVPDDIAISFLTTKGVAIIGQIICPGKGSFYAVLENLKKRYSELWCWMSIIGPSYKSYQRYGFEFSGDEREFWNVYKSDYSKFSLGKWKSKGG